MYPERVISTFKNFYHKLPFTGASGGFDFMTQRGPFAPAMSIKLLPLKDLSLPPKSVYNEFDKFVDNIKHNIKRGDLVKAVPVNGQFNESESAVLGRVSNLNIDYKHKRVRVFVRDINTNKEFEVYPETIFRENTKLTESCKYVMDYTEFISC